MMGSRWSVMVRPSGLDLMGPLTSFRPETSKKPLISLRLAVLFLFGIIRGQRVQLLISGLSVNFMI